MRHDIFSLLQREAADELPAAPNHILATNWTTLYSFPFPEYNFSGWLFLPGRKQFNEEHPETRHDSAGGQQKLVLFSNSVAPAKFLHSRRAYEASPRQLPAMPL
jgi:hypothetical protein